MSKVYCEKHRGGYEMKKNFAKLKKCEFIKAY